MNILQELADMQVLGALSLALAAIQTGRAVDLKIGISSLRLGVLLMLFIGEGKKLRNRNSEG